ncbi:ATPase inhibitor-like protein [Operophtera brumata]|uniref:Regulatory protein zeste n=1 Tax=Operophtera brumata TaxID=104452 RepID=A0A0L7KV02_OPEBR|nr:ATPase inhibitor-like protein [Operophtera brumata]
MWKPIIFDVECIVCNKSLQKIVHNPKNLSKDMGKVNNNRNRRSRTPNWSTEEKQYLLELIKARKEVVVTKSNNGPNFSEEKSRAWNEVLQELESRFGAKFNSSSIKKVKTQWQNMKRLTREEISQTGPIIHKLTKQTLEVCQILDMVKDGVLKIEAQHFNETALSTNVEIKTERIDEFISAEKLMKMESIKEERQVIRAMRETAELNKIIAEQKLKHVLWVKKTEMAMYSGELGSGAGKGGGGGGSIRDAGGSFGKMEVAHENEYFYKKQREQLLNLKGHLDKEIAFHQEQIKRHEDAIRRHKDQMTDMEKK